MTSASDERVEALVVSDLSYTYFVTPPDFLAIGHICHDKTQHGFIPGGTVAFSSILATQMGRRVSVLTSLGPDFAFKHLLNAVSLSIVNAPETTVFENIYHQGKRTQYLHKRASSITPDDLPANLRQTNPVLLGPIADEVDLGFLDAFENSILCVCPQGWMRQWDATGKVSQKPIENWERLAKATIISMSEEDVKGDWDLIKKVAGFANILIVTQSAKGSVIYERGKRYQFPGYPVQEVDPTGAGDVFASAFLLTYADTGSIREAAIFAMAAASLSVEKTGLEVIPSLREIEKRCKAYTDKYQI